MDDEVQLPQPPRPQTSSLATISVVLGVLGICACPVWPISIVLGALALRKMKQDPLLGGRRAAIAGIVLGVLGMITTGLGAWVQWNKFQRLVIETNADEARRNLELMWIGLLNYGMQHVPENEDGFGDLHLRGMPPSVPPTPNDSPSSRPQAWDVPRDSVWDQIGFRSTRDVRFVYSIVADRAARKVVIRAQGDLDDDGVRSTYELRCHIDHGGVIVRENGLHVENGYE